MIERLCWALLASIHAAPAFAFFNPSLLKRLYGVASSDPAFLLLQHRAALFLAVSIACVWAAFDPNVRRLVAVIAATSMTSFLLLCLQAGMPPGLRTIALADLLGLVPLAYATLRRSPNR